MTTWILEPRDTLVLRDGRPISGEAAQMTGVPVPTPQAIAGFLRTRSSVDENGAFVIPEQLKKEQHLQELLKIQVRGPWLGVLDNEGQVEEHLLPAPRDAVLFGDPGTQFYVRLGLRTETKLHQNEQTALPEGATPVFLSQQVKEKPSSGPPLWKWSKMNSWLCAPQPRLEAHQLEEFGVNLPLASTRTGLQIDDETQLGKDGMLFSTEHREFFTTNDAETNSPPRLSSLKKLCLLVDTDLDEKRIRPGTVPFAGKRRSVFLRKADTPPPTPPPGLFKQIAESRRLRLILVTPAFFLKGWCPTALLQPQGNVTVRLRAAIVPRPQTVSGWDFAKQCPKPSRRFVPAGSVYFLELSGGSTKERIQWLKERWWRAISDPCPTDGDLLRTEKQAQYDGYGLAIFGVDQDVPG